MEYVDEEAKDLFLCLTCGDEFPPPDTSSDKYMNYKGKCKKKYMMLCVASCWMNSICCSGL